MKKTFISIFIIICACVSAQVAIGKNSVTNSSVSLEFGMDNRGLLLPWVTSAGSVTGAVDGTMIYDITDKKVKYRKNGSWFDLSIDNTGIVNTTLQDALVEQTSAKTAVGINAATDGTSGILVLTDTNKAMILPKVDSPHLNIINPAAGMIVYDNVKHQLAIFNGTVWSFWKP
ncbi:hypothetical protein HHL23_18590 [Chryseobacterium sp. RP-3-3]|uniref:Uncharacterized protein n=1 Tax=Chryseobacterium antibioticum TaxID=2728847 RepID=A0A7Y0FSY8_9FLAO|nr:hypothetical protein [Chryseobacterium antibioticum]NML71787.1 hypothetical protein [Chryseobacterium antibioticum]